MAAQRKHIAFAVDEGRGSPAVASGMTRTELQGAVLELLRKADRQGKRVLFGFDHNYGLPEGFHEALQGEVPAGWREVLGGYAASAGMGAEAGGEVKAMADRLDHWLPREWAREANNRIGLALGGGAGPFWGTLFGCRPARELFRSYRLSDGKTAFQFRERRLAEERLPRLKPAYQLGGIGSIGQQSLFGLLHIHKLLEECRTGGTVVFVWPQYGLELPASGHVLAEMYPTLCLEYLGLLGGSPRSDAGDAKACVQWAGDRDREGTLAECFRLSGLTDAEQSRVRVEGWPLGLMP